MKEFLITLAVLGGIVLIGFLFYLFGFIYAYRNFGGPAKSQSGNAPELFQYITEGRLERLEGAIMQTMQNNHGSFVFKPGNPDQFPTLTIRYKGDEITYRLHLSDCHSINLLDDYELVAGCGTSHLTVLSVERNNVTIYDNSNNKFSQRERRIYKRVFEDSFYNSVKKDLEKQPVYNWRKSDSTADNTHFTLLDIFKGNDSNAIRTRHVFTQPTGMAGRTYHELRTEKHYGDSTIIIEYDAKTFEPVHKSTFTNGQLLRRYY